MLFQNVSEKSFPNLPVLSATQDNGMVFRDELDIDIKYDSKALKNYKRVLPGEFVISLRSFQGGFELSDKTGITSPAYTIFKLKSPNEHDLLFWKHLFKSYKFIESLKRVTFGIRDGKSISFSQFGDTKPCFPVKSEQRSIGIVLNEIDHLHDLHEVKLEQLKALKRGMLQKIFPGDGEIVPSIRSRKFTDDWQRCGFLGVIEDIDDFRGKTPKKIGMSWCTIPLGVVEPEHGKTAWGYFYVYDNREIDPPRWLPAV